MTDLIKGIDVSVVQGVLDWKSIADAGYKFVICRCGVGNEGIDGNYRKNIAGAKAVGLKVAAYHFLYPLPPTTAQPLRDPVKQAQYHFNAANGELACIDCEWPAPQDFAKWNCNPKQLNEWMLTYLREYERLSGKKPIVYTYPYWAQAVKFDPAFAEYPLWIASYVANPVIPKPWTDWVLWQSTGGTEKLPNGVPVDMDKAKDLSLWDEELPVTVPEPVAVVEAPVPEPTPVPTPEPSTDPVPVTATQQTQAVTVKPSFWQVLIDVLNKLFKK